MLQVVEDESKARGIAEFRAAGAAAGAASLASQARMSLDQLFNRIQEGEVKELPVILKADVQGSVEVLREALRQAVDTEKVKVAVLHTGRRRDLDQRRAARLGLEGDHRRLQRAARSAAPSSWPRRRGSRSASTPSSTS